MAGEIVFNFDDWAPTIVEELGSAPQRVAINMEQLRSRWEGQQTLPDDEAQKVLIERLTPMASANSNLVAEEADRSYSFINYVLANITPEYRTDAVLRGINLEPLMSSYEQWVTSLGDGQGIAPRWEQQQVPIVGNMVIEGDRTPWGNASFWVNTVKPGIEQERKDVQATANNIPEQDDVTLDPSSTGALSPTAAYADYSGSGTDEGWGDFLKGFESGQTGAIGFSEDDLYKAFSLSRSQDLIDLNTMIEQIEGSGTEVESPTFEMMLPENAAGSRQKPVVLNVAQALDYLRSANVNQTMIANLQDKMIAAGYADIYTDNINIGDGFDEVTTLMWGRLLADAYLQKKSIRTILAEKAQERSQNMPDLDTPSNNLLVDQVAQTLIGRVLSPDEKVNLWDAIRSDWATGSLAEGGQDPTLGYNATDVENFVGDELQQDVQSFSMAKGMDAVMNVLRRMT